MIELRYAKALFAFDAEEKNLIKRVQEFDLFMKVLRQNSALRQFLLAPHIDVKTKRTILENSFGSSLETVFREFLFFLLKKNRFDLVDSIGEAFKELVNQHLGIREVEVVTAVEMDVASEEKIRQKLESSFHKKIIIKKKIDPEIKGGVILIMGNEMVDWSLRGRMKQIKKIL